MLYGAVDTTDVPTSEAARIAQRYVIKLEPMLSIKNTLPFPITVSVHLKNTVDRRPLHEPQQGQGITQTTAPATAALHASAAAAATDGYASATDYSGRRLRYGFGNPQAELLAELENRRRQKEEEMQQKSRGTAAKLVEDNFVEATIPSHQSWVSDATVPVSSCAFLVPFFLSFVATYPSSNGSAHHRRYGVEAWLCLAMQ